MNVHDFVLPVRIAPPNAWVLELYSTDDALSFLESIPEAERTEKHAEALTACMAVELGTLSVENARWRLLRYARESRMLSTDMQVAVDSYGEIIPPN